MPLTDRALDGGGHLELLRTELVALPKPPRDGASLAEDVVKHRAHDGGCASKPGRESTGFARNAIDAARGASTACNIVEQRCLTRRVTRVAPRAHTRTRAE